MGTGTVVTVEAVSGTGKGIKANGQWYNRGKGAKFASFAGLKKGDVVELEANGNWVTNFSVNGQPASSVSTGMASAPSSNSNGGGGSSATNSTIARQTAIKAVLGSPLLAELYKDKDVSTAVSELKELMEQMTNYAITGKFIQEGTLPQ